jgi:hypothetical protein
MKKIFLIISVSIFANKSIAQKVGIGTIVPLMNLHVSSTDSAVALLENTQALNTNVKNALYFKTGNGATPYTGAIKTIGESVNAARLGLYTYASTSPNQLLERVSITDAGKVGIGTISPITKLHVTNSDSAVALFENTQSLSTNISNALYFKTGSGLFSYTGAIKTIGEGTNAARLGLFTFASASPNNVKERMSITDVGNVGIGVTAPQTTLQINPAAAGSLLIGTNKNAGGYTNIEMGISAQSNGYGYVQATKTSGSSYGSLALNPNGGNVGVGTSTPTSTLDVHGGISLPIKVVTSNYTVQADDYTIVVDMQNDTNKVVNIYLPPQLVNNGRIIKVVAINMDGIYGNQFSSNNNKNIINVLNGATSTLYEKLYNRQYDYTYFTNSYGTPLHHHNFDYDLQSGATFQCISTSGWVVTDLNKVHHIYELDN